MSSHRHTRHSATETQHVSGVRHAMNTERHPCASWHQPDTLACVAHACSFGALSIHGLGGGTVTHTDSGSEEGEGKRARVRAP